MLFLVNVVDLSQSALWHLNKFAYPFLSLVPNQFRAQQMITVYYGLQLLLFLVCLYFPPSFRPPFSLCILSSTFQTFSLQYFSQISQLLSVETSKVQPINQPSCCHSASHGRIPTGERFLFPLQSDHQGPPNIMHFVCMETCFMLWPEQLPWSLLIRLLFRVQVSVYRLHTVLYKLLQFLC